MISDKMMFGVRDQRVKECLLRDEDQSLAKVLDACHAAATPGNDSRTNTPSIHHQSRCSTKESEIEGY